MSPDDHDVSTVAPFDLLVIVAMGRSGSTLVQGLLNGLPNTEVTGENHFLLYRLYQAYDAISRSHERHGLRADSSHDPTDAWFGADRLDPSAALQALREIAMTQMWPSSESSERPDIRTRGFKEIRWHLMEPDDVAGFARFLNTVFGKVGWVLHVRSTDELAQSGWWARRPPSEVQARAAHLLAIHEAFRQALPPEDIFESDYAGITGSFAEWCARLIEWAGHQQTPELLRRLDTIRLRTHSRPTRRA